MSELSRLLNSELAGRGVREIAANAHAHGHKLSPGTVSKYLNGRHGRPSEPTLEALSDAFGIDLVELRIAAGVPAGEPDPYTPPVESARLTSKQREALDDLIYAIVKREDEEHVRSAPIVPGAIGREAARVERADPPPAAEASPLPTSGSDRPDRDG